MQLTPSQRKALDTTRHLAIIANAGSGKTRVLVQRYVDILEARSDLSPRNILAITFTEAAGAELRTRIAKEITDRLEGLRPTDSSEPLTPQQITRRNRLRQIRDGLASAAIGTIHAFASRLLRAYPVEANVDAAFGVLDQAEQRLMIEDAIGRVFYSLLEQAYDGEAMFADALQTFRVLGRKEMARVIRALLKNRTRVRTIQDRLLSRDEMEILGFWQETLISLIEPAIDPTITEAAEHVLGAVEKKTARARDAESALLQFTATKHPFERAHAFRALYKEIFKTDGDHALIKDGAALQQLAPDTDLLKKGFAAIEDLIDYLPANGEAFLDQHLEYLSHLKTIFFVYDLVLQNYAESKIELSVLDFDDLIERAQSLLSRPELQEELIGEYPYIMFDEFQDTDSAQYEIARSLTANFASRNTLAIVGDPKQSIYGFRNAEFAIFQQTINAIKGQQLSREALLRSEQLRFGPEEEYGELYLKESFRMAQTPLAFINTFFSSAMGKNSEMDSAPYTALVAGRASTVEGSVQMLLHDSRLEEENDDATGLGEAELIARKIVEIVGGGAYPVHVDEHTTRAATFADIAILLRSRSKLPVIEKAFRKYNIPHTVTKGIGFFAQQEITDILSYLKFLVNPSDDISLIATLRAPYFSFSDELLFKIAANTRKDKDESIPDQPLTFWKRLILYSNRHREDRLVHDAIIALGNNRLLVGRMKGSLLVEKIMTESGVYASLLPTYQGAQKVANLDKFHQLVRSAEANGAATLYDVVERLSYLMEEADTEAQADIHSSQPVVQIMTVHGAKGLEFPIVFAAFLGQKLNLDHQHILDPEFGFLYSIPETSSVSTKPAIAEVIRLRSNAKSLAEEERVLYVALTRARDHLFLSGTISKRIEKNSYLRWLFDAVPALEQSEQCDLVGNIQVYSPNDDVITEKQIHYTIPITRRPEEIELPEIETPAVTPLEEGIFSLEPVTLTLPRNRFSASQFLTYNLCPTKYYLAYNLGIPEEPKLAYDLEPDESSERVRGVLYGQLLHKLLERIDRFVVNDTIEEERFKEFFDIVCANLGIALIEERAEHYTQALTDLEAFLATLLQASLRNAAYTASEVPIQAGIGEHDRLYGILDRLFRDEDDTWTILDYKTDTLTSKNRAKRIKKHEEQLRIYAYLVSKLYPSNNGIKAVLYYTKTREEHAVHFTPEKIRSVEKEALKLIGKIRTDQSVKDLSDLKKNTDHCAECSFYDNKKKHCIVPDKIDLTLKTERDASKVADLL